MNGPFSGGCVCGAVRYTCSVAPLAMLSCHCLDCQRSSGAPFASGVVVSSSSIDVTGSPASYSVRASSGASTTRSFCPTCGSPLFTRGEASPEYTSIRFTALDDPNSFRPMLEIWTSSAQPWVCPSQEIPRFPQSP